MAVWAVCALLVGIGHLGLIDSIETNPIEDDGLAVILKSLAHNTALTHLK